MQTGLKIDQLKMKVMQDMDESRDFVVPTTDLHIGHDDNRKFNLKWDGHDFPINDNAHRQIAARLEIPQKYYKKCMAEDPDLLVTNVQTWFEAKGEERMVRTLGGTARAFLSNQYKRIDNLQILSNILPILEDSGVMVVSSNVTDNKMYVQCRFPQVEGEVKVGDFVQSGFSIANSEIGLGAFAVDPYIYRLNCLNGMKTAVSVDDGRIRKSHIGKRVHSGENYEVYSDETLKADDHALMLKIRDSVKALADPIFFQKQLEKMQAAANSQLIERPIKAAEELGKAFSLPEAEKEKFMENLIRDQDYSKWGTLNAITKIANDYGNYDRAMELQDLGGRILTLPDSQWKRIAEAA